YQVGAQLRPDSADVHNGLGNAHYASDQLDEAVSSYRRALSLRPSFAMARYNLGLALQAQGRLAEAQEGYREALRLQPNDHLAHGTYIGSLIYDPTVTAPTLRQEHRRWVKQHAPPLSDALPHPNQPDPDRPLRIGYVSPDFRSHAVAYFLAPILAFH